MHCTKCQGAATRLYIKPFKSKTVTEAHEKDWRMPRYAFHVAVECEQCGKWLKNLKQNDELLKQKFYAAHQEYDQEVPNRETLDMPTLL